MSEINTNAIEQNWWQSTGFLYGSNPSLNVDDPLRISTNIFSFSPPESWQPLATGVFNIPSAVDGDTPTAPRPHSLYSGGLDSTPLHFEQTTLAVVTPPDFCKANCTLGGCSDPTTTVHTQCVAAGCCGPHPTRYSFKPPQNDDVSQMGYGDADCTRGPGSFPGDENGYCRSQYTYNQCNPGSLWDAWQDPRCFPATFGNPVPYYVDGVENKQ